MSKIKVLLADDHDLFREGLRRMLGLGKEIEIAGEATNGSEAVRKARELLPDVVLMDIGMPQTDGIEATRQIKNDCPSVEVIVLSMYEDDEHLFRAIKAGAAGYILKNSPLDEVVRVVKAAHRGESLLNPALARRILDEFATEKNPEENAEGLYCDLTKRELEILKLLASAKTNRQIGKVLLVTEKTVKNHISNIYRKLQVNSRTEAVLKAIKSGLVESHR